MSELYRKNFALIDWSKPLRIRRKAATPPARSALPFPCVVSDSMEPTQSMLDGKFYTSKSALRATYRAAGCVEVGNDPQRLKPRPRKKVDRKAVKQTLDIAQARYERGERVNRRKIATT